MDKLQFLVLIIEYDPLRARSTDLVTHFHRFDPAHSIFGPFPSDFRSPALTATAALFRHDRGDCGHNFEYRSNRTAHPKYKYSNRFLYILCDFTKKNGVVKCKLSNFAV